MAGNGAAGLVSDGGHTNAAGPPTAADPYRAAQFAEATEAERAWRAADSWRRIASGCICALVIALLVVLVLAGKSQHDVVVYRETPHGIALMSEGVQTRTPLQSSVEHQLGLWLEDVRDVPGGDVALARRNAHNALVMTAKESPANQKLVGLFRSPENPVDLGASMTRTVEGDLVASPVTGTQSYIVGWMELAQRQRKAAQLWRCSGSIAIAPPLLPTDVEFAAIDPAGVFVEDYEWHCQPTESTK
ncbi:MAG: VirB8/TrbF family protein [Candidatus Baltobacteraceae bacterium]